jgi:hypothetical protein
MSVIFILRNIRILEFYVVGYVLGNFEKSVFITNHVPNVMEKKFNEFWDK